MKRYLLIALVACMALSVNARTFDKGERLYINMEAQSVKDAGDDLQYGWYSTINNYNFAYFFKGENGAWSTQVKQYSGTVWYVEAPKGDWDNVILTRHSSANANWDTRITQTGNISFYYKDGDQTKMRDQNYLQNFYYGSNKDQANWEYVAPAPSGNPATWTLTCEDEQICTSAAGTKYNLQAKNYDYDNTYCHAWFKYESGTWTRIQGDEWRTNEGDKTCEVTLGGVNSDVYYFLQCSRPSMCRLLRIRINQNCEEGAPGACKITSFVGVASDANVTDSTTVINGVVAFDDKKNAGKLQIWCPDVDTLTIENKDIKTPQEFKLEGFDASTAKTYKLYAKFLSGEGCDATCQVAVTPPSAAPTTHTTTGTEADPRLVRFTEEDVTLTPDNKDSKYFRWTNTHDDDTIAGEYPEERVHTFTAPAEEMKIDYYFLGTNDPPEAEGNLISNGDFETNDKLESKYTYWGQEDVDDIDDFYNETKFPEHKDASGGYALVKNSNKFYHTYNKVNAHKGQYFGLFDSKITSDINEQAAWIARSGEKNPKLKVHAGVSYLFSFWVANINSFDQMNNGARLQFQISYNGGSTWNDLGGEINLGNYKDNRWHGLSSIATPTVSSTNVVLRVVNKNTSSINIGNDFGLDDIRFEAITANSKNAAAFEKFPVTFLKCVINGATFVQRQPDECGKDVADVDYTVTFVHPRGDLYIYEGANLLAHIPHSEIGDETTSYKGVLKDQALDAKEHELTVYFDDDKVKTDAPTTYKYDANAIPVLNLMKLTWGEVGCKDSTVTLTAELNYTNQNGTLTANVDGKPANSVSYTVESNENLPLTLVIPNVHADGLGGHVLNVKFAGSHGCEIKDLVIPEAAPYSPVIDKVTISGVTPTVVCGTEEYVLQIDVKPHFAPVPADRKIVLTYDSAGKAKTSKELVLTDFPYDLTLYNIGGGKQTISAAFALTPDCKTDAQYTAPTLESCEKDSMIICEKDSYTWHGIECKGDVGVHIFTDGTDSLWLFVKAKPSLTLGKGDMTCDQANEVRLPITEKKGNPDLFDVTIDGKPVTGCTIDGTDFVIPLAGIDAGDHTGSVAVQETDVPCDSNASLNFTIAISDQMFSKWTDVLFISNKGGKYKAYQWFADGVEMKDETQQRLYDPKGLSGSATVYYCRLTTTEGLTLYTCPQTFDAVTPSRTQNTGENKVQSTRIYDHMGRSVTGTPHNGIYIVVEQLEDGDTRVRKVAIWE